MFSRLTGHMRHNLVAYLALFMALGGTSAWAAGQITGAQIRDDSVTGADVLESSLDAVPKALDATTLGTQSLTQVRSGIDADKLDGRDASAFLGNVVVRVSSQGSVVNPGEKWLPSAVCRSGETVSGGGYIGDIPADVDLRGSYPATVEGGIPAPSTDGQRATTWRLHLENPTAVGQAATVTVYALCASSPA